MFLYAGNSIQNANELFISCVHLYFLKFAFRPTSQAKVSQKCVRRFKQFYLGIHPELDTCSYEFPPPHYPVLSYLLTPWCRVLLEKLTGLQLVKKFPAFHRTRRFITALTSALHLSLSWANPIQSIYPHPTSWRSILPHTITSQNINFPPESPCVGYLL